MRTLQRGWRAATALLAALASPGLAVADPAVPEAEVREVVERYFRADALGSPEELKSAFAPKASILEKRGSQWVRVTPDALAARRSGIAPDESRRVRRVPVSGKGGALARSTPGCNNPAAVSGREKSPRVKM